MDASSSSFGISHVLKDDDTFIVADQRGDIGNGSEGLYWHDTRLLSRYRLRIDDSVPTLLSSSVSHDNVFFRAHLTNRPLTPLGSSEVSPGLIHIARTRFLFGNRLHERIVFTNFGDNPVMLPLAIDIAADFSDMFEVRGSIRAMRGAPQASRRDWRGCVLSYMGLDGLLRESHVEFSSDVEWDADGVARLRLSLPAGGGDSLYVTVGSTAAAARPSAQGDRLAAVQSRLRMRMRQRRGARVHTAAPLFNAWLLRSRADLALLTSELDTGPYPYAGIPWFSTPFGRDAVITGLQTLWLDPALSRGVLAFLAAHQARDSSTFMDSAPGKILHETRKGEMASLRELPFGLYYGGVDTTPLFVLLARAYADRTGEMAFIDSIWPALVAATGWIEAVCDAHPQGLLAYERGEASGLVNQGWKDSADSVFHSDGRLPTGPIALVEVQGYAFAALRGMAALARKRGDGAAADAWARRASRLRMAVERNFWCESQGCYGIAIDGEGALCEVSGSNAGHLLYVGLPSIRRAACVIKELLSNRFRSGWGLRTLATGEPRYNPMSYHNGSVWPHDNALCVAGIARYGQREAAVALLGEAFETAVHFEYRVPELFCGFSRVQDAVPVAYPVACLPQAWAAGSAFMLLQACLGLRIDGHHGAIRLVRPHLPTGVDELTLRKLQIGTRTINLVFKRYGTRIAVFAEGKDAAKVPLHLLS